MTRSTSRTTAGIAIPLMAIFSAAFFMFFAWMHRTDAHWLGMDRDERLGAVGAILMTAVATEWLVLRQINFLQSGNVVEAVVDQVRAISWSKEHVLADYHFFTEDGRVITSRCALPASASQDWQRGSRITTVYDPARPACHAVEARLWSVQGQIIRDEVAQPMKLVGQVEESGSDAMRIAA